MNVNGQLILCICNSEETPLSTQPYSSDMVPESPTFRTMARKMGIFTSTMLSGTVLLTHPSRGGVIRMLDGLWQVMLGLRAGLPGTSHVKMARHVAPHR